MGPMSRPRGRRRRLAAYVAAGLALLVAGIAAAALVGGSEDVSVTDEATTVAVGAEPSGERVSLDVSVFVPAPDTPGADSDGRRAAVLLAHGFGGDKKDLAAQAREVAREGYVVLTYTARGFGQSGGRIHLNSPDYEIADVSALLDLLAARDDVLLDDDGDPRVGVAGGSYGGAVALMAAAYDDRVDAIVPAITWNDLAEGLFPQNAVVDTGTDSGTDAGPGVFKRRWASLFFASGLRGGGSPGAAGDPACGRFDPEVCAEYDGAATSGRPNASLLRLLERSSPAPVLDRIKAPTLLVQGEQDSLFPLDQADANARGIAAAGTPVAVRWIDGGHDASANVQGSTELTEPALAWFDHYLRDGADPGTAFDFTLPASPFEEDGPEQLTASAYGDGQELRVALHGEAQPVLSPPGGEPTAVTGLPGTGPLLGAASEVTGAGYRLAALPGESAVFQTSPFETSRTVVGAPRVRLSVTSSTTDATLFVSGWVVSADGDASLPRQLVSPVHLDDLVPGQAREVEVSLPTSAYRLERDQRLRVVVASTDAAYAVPDDARAYQVALAGDQALVLPTVDAERTAGTGGLVPVPLLVAVLVLLVAAAGVAVWSRRRHRPPPVVEALAEVPLVVDGLVKEYASGFRAVDGVGWRAERGQVVGLLGPNGAGKTTTMRMLVGLIRPDGGTVHVLGHEVTAGSPVLGRVGALIEGPGFLPHLTGRQNLEAYWAATGHPDAEAGFDEALATADLGVAVDRPVRSYSHGMRQRLGIAQAMLGLPELLLLDEPTNGLDPPQIRTMRGVLSRYAAGGRTVVVSSHLLSEVEQTCSHVVVMHRGRVVLEGAVADLVEQSGSTLVSVDGGDPATAARVLAAVEGVSDVEVESDGRVRVRGSTPRPQLVRAAVLGGVAVSSVDGRRHLEEVFMSLVGDGEPAQVDPARTEEVSS
jgi:ABC-2 type transport system ATP-binding protein